MTDEASSDHSAKLNEASAALERLSELDFTLPRTREELDNFVIDTSARLKALCLYDLGGVGLDSTRIFPNQRGNKDDD